MAQGNLAAFWTFAGNKKSGVGRAASNLQDQLHRASGCDSDALWVYTSLEAVAGIAEKTQHTRGAAHTERIENGALQKNIGGGLSDGTPLATHDTCQGCWAIVIGDDQ